MAAYPDGETAGGLTTGPRGGAGATRSRPTPSQSTLPSSGSSTMNTSQIAFGTPLTCSFGVRMQFTIEYSSSTSTTSATTSSILATGSA
jgi:hypothetical protein